MGKMNLNTELLVACISCSTKWKHCWCNANFFLFYSKV